jgi:CHAT domain
VEYEDFEIRIDRGRDDAYSVAVRSLAGEDDASMRFPFSPAELEQQLRNLGLALSPEDEASNQNQPPSFVADSTVRVFGTALFQALLPDGLYALYAQSETIAADDEKRLRIVLRIQAPELVGVPWEIVHNPHRRSFLALSPDASVVRYLETPSPRPRLRGAAPLRVLGVAARPNDLVTLDTSSEQCYIEAALGRLQDEGQVALRWLASQTWRDLQDELSGGHWHVVHFIGHGGFDSLDDEGFIVLVDEENQTRWLTADELGMLLEGRHSIRLVVLNACEGGRSSGRDLFSSVAATLGRVGIPAVVAMQHPIRDSAAIEFSRTFYRRLARPTPIDEAMVDARQALRVALRGTVAWATPVLYMRAEDAYILVPNADAREGAVAARPPQPAPTTPLVAPPPEPQKPPATEATAPEPAKPVPQRARARKSAPEPKAAAAEKPTPAPKRRQ